MKVEKVRAPSFESQTAYTREYTFLKGFKIKNMTSLGTIVSKD